MPIDTDKTQAEATYYRAAITDLFAQMDLIDERIARNQSETERLRAETWVMLDQMQTDQRGGRGQAPPLRGCESGT